MAQQRSLELPPQRPRKPLQGRALLQWALEPKGEAQQPQGEAQQPQGEAPQPKGEAAQPPPAAKPCGRQPGQELGLGEELLRALQRWTGLSG